MSESAPVYVCSVAAQHSHVHMYIEISQVDIFNSFFEISL